MKLNRLKYPHNPKSWYIHWENLMVFLGYSEAIRKVIYTTNSVASVDSQLCKVTKNKRVFANDHTVFTTLILAIDYINKKLAMPIPNSNAAIAHFLIKLEGRI